MNGDLLRILNDSIDPKESIRKNALISLLENTDAYINDLLLFFSCYPDQHFDDKLLFLILNFTRHLYLACSSKTFQTLTSISENVFNNCFNFFTIMPLQAGPAAATVLIFLAKLPVDFLQNSIKITSVEHLISNLISKCSSDIHKVVGLYEFLITICFSLKLNMDILFQAIHGCIFNEEINKSDDIVNKGIELLSVIVFTQEINVSMFDSKMFSHFEFMLTNIENRVFLYRCFSAVVKYHLDFIPEDLLLQIAQSANRDLSNRFFMHPIFYLLRVLIKKGFIIFVYENFLAVLYHISISHQKDTISHDEEYDEFIAALSVIELLIEHSTSSTKYEFSKFPNLYSLINFENKENPQVLETSFRLLSSFILFYRFFEDNVINGFFQLICIHMDDQHLRVREASLWALHSICVKYTYLNETIFSQCYLRLSQFFSDCPSIAAISIEILREFSVKNVCGASVQIFQTFLSQLSNSYNDEFLFMRLKRSLLSICSTQSDVYYEYISAICEFLLIAPNVDIVNFVFELIEQILLNNQTIPHEILNMLCALITKYEISVESISALTTLFLSFGDEANCQFLGDLFEKNLEISNLSILRFSLAKQDLSFLQYLWDKLDEKDELVKEIYQYFRHNEDKLCLFETQYQLIISFFDVNYLIYFLKLLTLFISNCFDSQKWIDFGCQIIYNHQEWINNNITEKLIKTFIQFSQSVASANLPCFLQMFSDPYFVTLLDAAHNFANLYVDADSLLILLKNSVIKK